MPPLDENEAIPPYRRNFVKASIVWLAGGKFDVPFRAAVRNACLTVTPGEDFDRCADVQHDIGVRRRVTPLATPAEA